MKTKSLAKSIGLPLLAWGLVLPSVWAANAPISGDTYVSSGSPATNFGTATSLIIAPGNRALIQFDLSSIPGSSTIAKAYLRVYVNKVNAAGTLDGAPVLSAWSENTVSAATAPVVGSPLASASATVANAFVLLDVTPLVQSWIAAPSTNLGIALTGQSSTSLQLDSRENALTSHGPELEITITGPAGTSGATGPTGPTGASVAGAAGATGARGATGAAGPAGIGAVGATGPAGVAGATGATGPVGAQGPAGATGASGPVGVAGATGPTGPVGASGPSGPAGATGAVGLAGSAGAAGPTGASGPSGLNGPTSNRFNLDTTLHGTYTIPDSDTNLYYLTNNPAGTATTCGGAVTITLPHANVVGSGRMVVVSPGNVPNRNDGVQCPGVTLAVQSGDTFLNGAANTSAHPIVSVSDGAGHWIIINNSGR